MADDIKDEFSRKDLDALYAELHAAGDDIGRLRKLLEKLSQINNDEIKAWVQTLKNDIE